MKKVASWAILVLMVCGLEGWAAEEDGQREKGVLAGKISIHVEQAAGREGRIVEEGIRVVFVTTGKDGPVDVDKFGQGEDRMEVTTGSGGYYQIKRVDVKKSYQIRRIEVPYEGGLLVHNPGYVLAGPKKLPRIEGVLVIWHKVTLRYVAGKGFWGIHEATSVMTDDDTEKARGMIGGS